MTSSARRQLFRRSKAGCWNCRSKKKKCDELRPHCTRCLRAGEGCRYPDTSSESLVESSHPMSPVDRASPSITSSTSFPGGMSMHTSPMLSRSSSTSGYSSQHPSRRPPHTPYHHHPYAPTSEHHVYASPSDHHRAALQHQEYHAQRPASHQRPLTPPSSAAPYPYYAGSHPMAQTHPSHQHFVPPPLSASAATDWDHTSQQHLYKRPRYDDLSSSSSTASSHPVYQDARSRQPFEPHHRIPSNHSQTSSKGKTRDTLPPISPIRPESIPMTISASLPPINGVSPPSHRVMASPSFASRSADTSPANRVSPVVAKHHAFSAASPNGFPEHLPAPTVSPPNQASAPLAYRAERTDAQLDAPLSPSPQPASTLAQPRHKLVFDYASNDPDPAHFLHVLQELPQSVVTQPTKGAHAYFGLLQAIARMPHGQAMAHALAAMAASHQANSDIAPLLPNESSDKVDSPSVPSRATLVELANRHHLSAIKALQTQQQPSRRRRFSVIETNNTNTADELPPASNAATMMLLIHACSSISKSLMLPSYFNQCEQFLADAVEHVSTHRLFPSVSGQAIVGSPEDPPIFPPDNLTNYGGLLFLGSAVGLYECYLSQFTAITDWDYNPSRLKRLLPFNWTDSDAAVFDQTRKSASETTLSVSMVTLELVIETLDTMRKLMRAETTAYGGRKSSRSEAEDGTAALDSLALREELGLVIRDLEQGAFWKGAARTLSEAEQRSVLLYASGQPVDNDVAAETEHASHIDDAEHSADEPVTKIFQSGSLFLPSSSAERKRVVNRLRLANHLYRNALLVDLYVTVFHRPASSLAVRQLVERSIALLRAVPEQREQGLMWPAIVLGSYAQDDKERSQVRNFVQRSQWKSTTGSSTASDVLERVWADDSDSWRESVSYFGSPYIS